MTTNQPCNCLSADWLFDGISDDGFILRSVNKNVKKITVPFSQKQQIKLGWYQSQRRTDG